MEKPKTDTDLLAGIRLAAFSENAQQDSLLKREVELNGGRISFIAPFSEHDRQQIRRLEGNIASQFANSLLTGEIDFVVFVTGVGARFMIEQAGRQVDRQRFIDTLSDVTTIAGSGAAAHGLLEYGIRPSISLDRPKSWRDVLVAIDQSLRVSNFNVGLEESNSFHGLGAGIEARGGRVFGFPVFPQVPPSHESAAIDFFESIAAFEFQVFMFNSAADVSRYYYLARRFGRVGAKDHLEQQIVVSRDAEITELLKDKQIRVDFTCSHPGCFTSNIEELASHMKEIRTQRQVIHETFSGPATSGLNPQAPWYENPFMKACRGEPTDVTPVWLMRQAGRYMKEYREVRDKVGFLELCANPQLCSEVMCVAVNKLGVDAAIIFSDLLPILVPMGMDLEFAKGDGPVIHNPIRTAQDIRRVKRLENNEELMFVMETVTQTRRDLPDDIPLIGFAGAPFTLASYMIEGGSSRNYANTKKLMYDEPTAWEDLMQHLSHSIAIYLNGQITAGAQVLQLFDSWAGCLAFEDYRKFVLPYVKQIVSSLPAHVPVINFATGNPALLPLLADTRAAVIGVDWRIRLDDAWAMVGHERSVQGNLDPTVLLSNISEIKSQAEYVLDLAAKRPGHIFNLGHGILPETPVENAIALVDIVHELSQR